jgi:hypothetical protein
MTLRILAAGCAVALSLATPACAGQLLSIQGFRLPATLHVDTLDLTIPDAHVLAYCHIPSGWGFSTKEAAGKALNISGGATGTVAELQGRGIAELKGFLLFDDTPVDLTKWHGQLTTIEYGGFPIAGSSDMAGSREDDPIKLGPEHLTLTPADRCPPAHAAIR